jgi:hypothetical protein
LVESLDELLIRAKLEHMGLRRVVGVISLLLVSRTAWADPEPTLENAPIAAEVAPAPEPLPPPTYRSYRIQIAAADLATLGAGFTLLLTSGGENPGVLAGLGLLGAYFVASPIVHVAHGRFAAAAASFGLRAVGVPLAGAVGLGLGSALCNDRGSDYSCSIHAVFTGALGVTAGLVAATAIDAEYLAREEVPRPSKTSFRLLPSLDPRNRSATLAAAATF